jgi:ABC-type transport system involved in multi-copper enzyme maturation permease subunit
MKYLAILRDSFREALDSKILYVTFGLSGLLVLFIGSVSIRPLTMEDELNARARMLQFIFSRGGQQNIRVDVQDFKQTNDAAEPWNGDYQFSFVLSTPLPPGVPKNNPEAQGMRSMLDRSLTRQLAPFIEALFWRLNITEQKIEQGAINEFRLRVTSKGTKVNRKEDWNHEPVLFFGALPANWFIMSPAQMVYFIEDVLVNAIGGWIIVLLGIIATASFVPNLLRRGSIDLIVSKPVSRSQLLLFKYLGGLTFLFLNASFIIILVWVIVGLRSSIWSWGFLLTIPILTFFFGILYAVSVFLAVWTRSTVVCILLTIVAWFVIWLFGLLYGLTYPDPILPESAAAKIDEAQNRSARSEGLELPAWASGTIRTVHKALPRTRDLGKLTSRLLSEDLMSDASRRYEGLGTPLQTSWLECIGISCAWIALLLGLSCWMFSRRDF